MSVTYSPEGDVVGAGWMGGFGANSLPLWLLLFLGLTRNGEGVLGGGNVGRPLFSVMVSLRTANTIK